MSYDIYSYRPNSPEPSLTDAQAIVERDVAFEDALALAPPEMAEQERIAAAILEFNPRLTRFQLDFAVIANIEGITESAARARFSHIELNSPEGDRAIQLTIEEDRVVLTIPYWYQPADSEIAFEQIIGYLKVLQDVAGYFAYDPQTGTAFDPCKIVRFDTSEYDRVMKVIPGIIAASSKRKPWWRFW